MTKNLREQPWVCHSDFSHWRGNFGAGNHVTIVTTGEVKGAETNNCSAQLLHILCNAERGARASSGRKHDHLEHDPKLRIQLPDSVEYVGADRWVLYGIADCELHAFVDLDRKKNLERLYWVQFEQYIPTRPELHHTYDSPEHVTIGGLDFYVDSWVRASDEKTETGSDREHIDALIRARGYVIPANMIYVRLVHLFDAEKRKELMIIYGENLASIGLKAEDWKPGGKAHDQWPTLERSRVERAKTKIAIEETGEP